MRNIVICAFLVVAGMGAAPPVDLPEELRPFLDLLEDEDHLIDSIREFDQRETALAGEERELAKKAARTGRADEAQQHRENAAGRLAQVDRAYAMALERYPENARAHTYYGELLYDYLGDEVRGVQEWERAKTLDPKHSLALNNLGIHYCHVGVYDKGIEYLEESLRLDPDHPDLLFNLSQVYLVHPDPVSKRHDWDRPKIYREAMKLSKKAAELEPADYSLLADYARNFFLAEQSGVKPEWAKAAKAWKQAREHARNDDETFHTWLFEARARLRAGQNRRARECLVQAGTIHPDSRAVKNLLEQTEAGRSKQ